MSIKEDKKDIVTLQARFPVGGVGGRGGEAGGPDRKMGRGGKKNMRLGEKQKGGKVKRNNYYFK